MSETALYGKIVKVVQAVEGVAKAGHNDHFNYDYTTAEDILRAIRGPLAEQNVALMPSLSAIEERQYRTSKGNESIITTVHVDFTFADGETGEMFKCSWAGQGDDPADKGLGKAYTNCIKTFLRETFLLPQGDDSEADSSTDARAAERQSSRPRQFTRGGDGKPSEAQLKFLKRIIAGNAQGVPKPNLAQLTILLERVGGPAPTPGWMDLLTRRQCSELLTKLKEEPLPDPDAPSDVLGAAEDEFVHPPITADDQFFPSEEEVRTDSEARAA